VAAWRNRDPRTTRGRVGSDDHAEAADHGGTGARAFEGADLADVLAVIHDTLGPDAEILEATRIRTGGVGGFFSKERVQVVARGRFPDGVRSAAGAAERAGRPRPPVGPSVDALLDWADAVSERDRTLRAGGARAGGARAGGVGPEATDLDALDDFDLAEVLGAVAGTDTATDAGPAGPWRDPRDAQREAAMRAIRFDRVLGEARRKMRALDGTVGSAPLPAVGRSADRSPHLTGPLADVVIDLTEHELREGEPGSGGVDAPGAPGARPGRSGAPAVAPAVDPAVDPVLPPARPAARGEIAVAHTRSGRRLARVRPAFDDLPRLDRGELFVDDDGLLHVDAPVVPADAPSAAAPSAAAVGGRPMLRPKGLRPQPVEPPLPPVSPAHPSAARPGRSATPGAVVAAPSSQRRVRVAELQRPSLVPGGPRPERTPARAAAPARPSQPSAAARPSVPLARPDGRGVDVRRPGIVVVVGPLASARARAEAMLAAAGRDVAEVLVATPVVPHDTPSWLCVTSARIAAARRTRWLGRDEAVVIACDETRPFAGAFIDALPGAVVVEVPVATRRPAVSA
jgi:hypothetical protein